MATLVNKMNRDVKVIIPNMREFRVFYSDNEGSTMFFKRDWEEEKTTKQEEQMWSEEDEGELQNAIDALEFLGKKGVYKSESGYDAALQAAFWLKSILERFIIQPKQEWGEVELEFRGEKVKVKRPFFRDDNSCGYSTTEQDEDVAWNALRAWCEKKDISLYDLYPREEWSDEDENFINMLILHFNYLIDKGGESIETYKSYREKLKSLRPQYYGDVTMTEAYKMGLEAGKASSWKPSEEQMKALERTIHLANFGLEEDRRKALVSLCEHLKKLM